jgi:cell cycle arrest protein BUB3
LVNLAVVHFCMHGAPGASSAFSPQGDLLAVASSYMHEFGQREAPPDAIFIRPVQDAEVKPKPRKNAPQ